jgi:cell wall-associated NlpC family hydrolase
VLTLRRTAPVALAGVLGLGLLAAPIPAQAAPIAPATTTPATTTATSTSTATAAQLAQAAAARKAAARRAAIARKAAIAKKKRVSAVRIARAQLGDSYIAGRSGPSAFDCSGLTRFVVQRAVGRSLPHYSKAQYAATKRVARKNLKPGDLVFFFRYGAHHVGMYVGNGKMVHAANPRADVRVDHVFRGWYGQHYSGAGRVITG